jgi:hypothetical protein
VKPEAQVDFGLGGVVVGLLALREKVGARIDGEFNAETRSLGRVQQQTQLQADAQASGILESVDTTQGVLTIKTDAGAVLTLKAAGDAKVLINNAPANVASLKTLVGGKITVYYAAGSMTALKLVTEARANQQIAISGSITTVNPLQGTVTIATPSGEVTVSIGGNT